MEKLRRETAIILGAASSATIRSYGTGGELLNRIVGGSLESDTTLNCDEYWNFKERLADAPDASVDAFLEGTVVARTDWQARHCRMADPM